MRHPARSHPIEPSGFRTKSASDNRQAAAALLRLLADDENSPAPIHCASGKNRTAVVATLVLAVVGLAGEVIVRDYAVSSRFLVRMRSALLANPRTRQLLEASTSESVDSFFDSSPRIMQDFLAAMGTKYGSLHEYVGGLDDGHEIIEGLTRALVE